MIDTDAIRADVLSALKDNKTDSTQLQNLLDKIEESNPEILNPEDNRSFLSDNSINSYDQNIVRLERDPNSFSRERIEYLIRLREHFKEIGVKGFAPTPSEPIGSGESKITMNRKYTPSDNLKEFLEEGDLLSIRTALRMELNDNRLTSSDLKEAIKWAKSKVHELFEPYAEKAFARGMEENQDLWTSQYYDGQIVYLKRNFSEARLLHLIKVRDFLRTRNEDGFEPIKSTPKGIDNSVQSVPNRSSPNSTKQSTDSQSYIGLKKILLLIGGACALFFIAYLSKTRQ